MTTPPMFRQDPNDRDGGYLLSPAGALLMIGNAAHETDDNEITPAGRAKAQRTLARILSAARAGGFTQGDLLDTLLAKREVSVRVHELAHAAVDAAGKEAMIEIVNGMVAGNDS